MTAAPKGQSKAAEENKDAVAQAATKSRQQRSEKEQKKVDEAVHKPEPEETDKRAKVTTGSPAEGEVLPKAEPEAVSEPGDEQKPADDDNATPSGVERSDLDPAKEGPATFSVAPATPGPNDTVPEGEVEITHRAEEGQPGDPSGNFTERKKTGKSRAPKKDPLTEIDTSKLPVAVAVGQVTGSIEEYAGNAVLSLSLRGWVGEAPLKIRASDIGELEQVISELRSQVG